MHNVNSNIVWTVALLLIAAAFVYLVYWSIRKGLFRKAEVGTFAQDAYGWHLAFAFFIAALLLFRLPELLDAGMYVVKSDTTRSLWREGIKLSSIFFGISTVFFFVIYFLSYTLLKMLWPKTTLEKEVAVNNVGYVLQHAAIMLLLLLVVQYNFIALCKYFLPQSNIPFYR